LEDSIDHESGIQALLGLIAAVPASVYPIFFACSLLLVASALISGSEVAFFSLTPQQLDQCKQSKKSNEQLIYELISSPKRLLATILILNNLVNVALVTLATFATWEIAGRDNELAVLLLTIIITSLIVFFGEIVPKVFATERNIPFAKFTARALQISTVLFRPFAWLLMNLSELVEKRLKSKGYDVTVYELDQAVELTTSGQSDKKILKSIVSFGTKTTKQVMRSRMDLMAVDIEEDFHELMDKVNKFSYSRVPVYNDTIDNIEGVLYVKDLLPYIDKDETFPWQKLIRKNTFFVPEHKKIDELLKDFQEMRVHMAIVVDEYGGTSGLVTMEDVIEEIIGEINDEFDTDEKGYKKIDATSYVFEGKTSLNDFCKIMGVRSDFFDEVKGDSESMGGLLLELFAKLPNAGERMPYRNFVFTPISVDKKRIKSIRVLVKEALKKQVSEEPKGI